MRIEFEKTECTRCGGSGQYSYNPMYGTRCFKCAGKGTHLSEAGAKAFQAWTEAKKEAFAIPASDVFVGMRIVLGGRRVTVTEVKDQTESRCSSLVNGVMVPCLHIGSDRSGMNALPDTLLQRVPTTPEFRALAEGFRTMKGCTVVDEEPANA